MFRRVVVRPHLYPCETRVDAPRNADVSAVGSDRRDFVVFVLVGCGCCTGKGVLVHYNTTHRIHTSKYRENVVTGGWHGILRLFYARMNY